MILIPGERDGFCKLCGGSGPLQRSHILPELLRDHLYDDKHRSIGVTLEKKTRIFQLGHREYLLCSGCETKLSKWEDYGKRIIRRIDDMLIEADTPLIQLQVDYNLFKLFQLSLLWRVGVSQHPVFSKVDLGPHEKSIRKMINQEEPGDRTEYGCFLIGYRGENAKQILINPLPTRVLRHKAIRFIVHGLHWNFIVSSHSKEIEGKDSFLSKSGILTVHVQ